jgi:hypothetical protein
MEIERELATFRCVQLPRIHREFDMSDEPYATVHLQRWEEDDISNCSCESYPLAKLFDEQERFRQEEGSV